MHERTMHIAVAHEIPQDVHDLGVEDGGRFEMFASRSGASQNEDTRADDRADSERGQRPGPERFLELVAGFGCLRDELVDGLTGKKLTRQRIAPASPACKSNRGYVWNVPE